MHCLRRGSHAGVVFLAAWGGADESRKRSATGGRSGGDRQGCGGEPKIVNNTKCGMLTFKDEELEARLQRETGQSPVVPARFLAFTDLKENVRQQIHKVRSHPWIPASIPVRGFIYDVDTGRLAEVAP